MRVSLSFAFFRIFFCVISLHASALACNAYVAPGCVEFFAMCAYGCLSARVVVFVEWMRTSFAASSPAWGLDLAHLKTLKLGLQMGEHV